MQIMTKDENCESSDENIDVSKIEIGECLIPGVFISEDYANVTGDSDNDLFWI